MPLRAPKMYGFIFGFQRLVWWPKWTPASSSWRMVIPCAGCIACCMAPGSIGGAPLWVVSTFSDIRFCSSTSVAPDCRPRFGGTPPGSGGVWDGVADYENDLPSRHFPGRGAAFNSFRALPQRRDQEGFRRLASLQTDLTRTSPLGIDGVDVSRPKQVRLLSPWRFPA